MPRQRLRVGPLVRALRHLNRSSVHRVVVAAVFKLVPYPTAYLEMMARCDRHITPIKQAVNVSTEKETINWFVDPLLRVRPNVRRIQRRERSFTGHSTTSLIIISHHDAKCALSQTRPDQRGLAPALRDWYATDKRLMRRFCRLIIRRAAP